MSNFKIITLALLMMVTLSVVPVLAQEQQTLTPGETVEGAISGDEPAVYTFYAWKDDVFSFHVEGLDGFDPVLTVQASGGEVIAINDDYAYPNHTDSLLQAITIPRNGNYEVRVSSFNDAGGEYRLIWLPGYADLVLHEEFDQIGGWEADDTVQVSIDDNALRIQATGVQVAGGAHDPDGPEQGDFYAQVQIASVSGRSGWSAGLMLRRQSNGDHYLFLVNSTGQWRFEAVENGSSRVIRDWTPHPAISAGESSFTLGVLANGQGFDTFYNDRVLGSVQDSAISGIGHIGLAVVTPNALDGEVTARFDNLIVTAPLLVDGADVFPQQLVRGPRSQLIMELERRRVIPPGGQLILTVEESFVERTSPGVSVVPLGRGVRFTDVVVGTTAVLQGGTNGVSGCGLVLRRTGDTNYTIAFVDNAGGHGVSERSDDTFNDGLFNETPALNVAESAELLVVVLDDVLHFFVNGVHAGTMDVEPVEGEIGSGVLNFDPQSANCRFTDTWVWRWN